MAAIVSLYLQQKYPQLPLQIETFEKIVPSIAESVEQEEEELFTERDLVLAIVNATKYFEKVKKRKKRELRAIFRISCLSLRLS